ncbi:MAG: hypothetical protein K0Q71_3163, partial [Thermomicrobiales bacterium]|nr:hypothetical protein [Thermomicrobiales bacterium]
MSVRERVSLSPDGPHPNPSPIVMGEGLFGAGD